VGSFLTSEQSTFRITLSPHRCSGASLGILCRGTPSAQLACPGWCRLGGSRCHTLRLSRSISVSQSCRPAVLYSVSHYPSTADTWIIESCSVDGTPDSLADLLLQTIGEMNEGNLPESGRARWSPAFTSEAQRGLQGTHAAVEAPGHDVVIPNTYFQNEWWFTRWNFQGFTLWT